jgi:hypothetical protein
MAGQSVGLIDRIQPLAEILAELVGQTVTALERGAGAEAELAEAAE